MLMMLMMMLSLRLAGVGYEVLMPIILMMLVGMKSIISNFHADDVDDDAEYAVGRSRV